MCLPCVCPFADLGWHHPASLSRVITSPVCDGELLLHVCDGDSKGFSKCYGMSRGVSITPPPPPARHWAEPPTPSPAASPLQDSDQARLHSALGVQEGRACLFPASQECGNTVFAFIDVPGTWSQFAGRRIWLLEHSYFLLAWTPLTQFPREGCAAVLSTDHGWAPAVPTRKALPPGSLLGSEPPVRSCLCPELS